MIRILPDAHVASIDRLYPFEDLETEPSSCTRHAAERLPELDTPHPDLRRFEDSERLNTVLDLLQEIVVEALRKQPLVTLDMASTVETLDGRQENTSIGPNPLRSGRPSDHPSIARDRVSDRIVHHVLRSESAGTATNTASFLHKTPDIVKEGSPTARSSPASTRDSGRRKIVLHKPDLDNLQGYLFDRFG